MTTVPVLVGVVAAILLSTALHDLAFRTIPNWMSGTLLFIGGGLKVLEGKFAPGLLACGLILLGAALCWRCGWLGGGDVKLLAACGLLVPPGQAVALLLDTALAGGLLALSYLALRQLVQAPQGSRPAGFLLRIVRVERHRVARGGPLPYASAIAAGALLVLLRGS